MELLAVTAREAVLMALSRSAFSQENRIVFSSFQKFLSERYFPGIENIEYLFSSRVSRENFCGKGAETAGNREK